MRTKTANTVMWSAIERFSAQGIQFLLTLVIARLVQPSDYGLIAMVGVFLALAQTFIDSGFTNALVQKQDRTEVDFSTVFYFNIVIGLILYFLLFLMSPLIARFYNEPQLVVITRIVGLNLVVGSFAVIQRAKLIIALNFRVQAFATLISVVLSGTAGVWMAYKGFGVWALIIQTLAQNIINTIVLWSFARWLPGFCFSWVSFRRLFGFGSKILLSGVLQTIYLNLYNIVIGKRFSAADLGYYNRAYSLASIPSTNIGLVISRAIYPIQCSMQNNIEVLTNNFLSSLRKTSYLVFPLMIGLCILAKPFVEIVLTDKWLPIVPLLQILCIAYIWDPIMVLNCIVLTARGRSDYTLKAEIIKKAVVIIILFTTMRFGILIMCIGLIIYSLCDIFIITRYTYRELNCGMFRQLKALMPIFILNISMGIVIYFLNVILSDPLLQIVICPLAGILYYITVSFVFKLEEADFIRGLIFKRYKKQF